MNHLVGLSIQAYTLLLRLYPTSFRSEFEAEMGTVFAQAVSAAAKEDLRSVLAFWFREAWDWPGSLLQEVWFDLRHRRGSVPSGSQHHEPGRPDWVTIGLILLPGLFVFGSSWVIDARGAVPILGLALCVLLVVASLYRSFQLPPWTYPTLGVSLGLLIRPFWPFGLLLAPLAILAMVRWFQRQEVHLPRSAWLTICLMLTIGLVRPVILSIFPNRHLYFNVWDLAGDGALLAVVALGLLLARRGGIMASLFVLACGFVLCEEVLDLTYGLWKTPWGIVMMAMLALLLLIISPLWMLLARTTGGRVVGALLPTAVALACMVILNALVRTQPSVLDNILNLTALVPATAPPWIGVGVLGSEELWPILIGGGMTAVQLFLGMALSTVLYNQLSYDNGSASPVATGRAPAP